MDKVLQNIRNTTTDGQLSAALKALPPHNSKPYACKLAKLRTLLDNNPQFASSSLAQAILATDVARVSRWLLLAEGGGRACVQATEAVLAVLKHAFPGLPPPLRQRYQRAWRQAYAAAKQQVQDDTSLAATHPAKARALKAALDTMCSGDQDRCLLAMLLRLGGRLNNELLGRMGNLRVVVEGDDDHTGEQVEDVVQLMADGGGCFLAFRDQLEDGGVQQVRAVLTPDVAAEVKASLDLRPRTHLFVQRSGQPYLVPASFKKRMRAVIGTALEAAGQTAMSLAEVLAVARSQDEVVEGLLEALLLLQPDL